ncbi:hypothetical protein LINGRAHAP2_LOCUS12126 [Linum grandiflorum]
MARHAFRKRTSTPRRRHNITPRGVDHFHRPTSMVRPDLAPHRVHVPFQHQHRGCASEMLDWRLWGSWRGAASNHRRVHARRRHRFLRCEPCRRIQHPCVCIPFRRHWAKLQESRVLYGLEQEVSAGIARCVSELLQLRLRRCYQHLHL